MKEVEKKLDKFFPVVVCWGCGWIRKYKEVQDVLHSVDLELAAGIHRRRVLARNL